MVCCDASFSRAEGRMESLRGRMCAHRPLTVPSRSPIRSLTSIHSHSNTLPVMATRSTRFPSPETWSDTCVAFPVKTQVQIRAAQSQNNLYHNMAECHCKHLQLFQKGHICGKKSTIMEHCSAAATSWAACPVLQM